jgi:hypothetical protein
MIVSTGKITFVAIPQNACKVFVKTECSIPVFKRTHSVFMFFLQNRNLISLDTELTHLAALDFFA